METPAQFENQAKFLPISNPARLPPIVAKFVGIWICPPLGESPGVRRSRRAAFRRFAQLAGRPARRVWLWFCFAEKSGPGFLPGKLLPFDRRRAGRSREIVGGHRRKDRRGIVTLKTPDPGSLFLRQYFAGRSIGRALLTCSKDAIQTVFAPRYVTVHPSRCGAARPPA